jgi:hypothetical protein
MGEYISHTDRMTVDLPDSSVGRYHIRHFTVKPGSVQGMRFAMQGRPIYPGTYTKLVVGKDPDDPWSTARLWMSDTPAEKRDHVPAVAMIDFLKAKRVIINGLGLGMVLKAALSFDHVEHVDVVEISEEVIKLVGPHYTDDPRVNIIQADAYEQAKAWPTGTRWDVGWSDIWMDMDTDDLAGHARLNRSYGQRCQWHECWVHDLLVARRRAEREEERRWEAWHS